MSDLKKRKKRQYFESNAKKSKSQFSLKPGLKGFLCTCNLREKQCIREAYNLLNEYADKLLGEEVPSERTPAVQQPANKKIIFKDSDDEDESEDDIQSALAIEVNALKEVNTSPSERRFQVVESGVKNCLFIRTTIDDPVSLVETILKDLELTQQQKTRFLLRLIPIEITCKAWPDEIKEASEKLLHKYFKGEPRTFCVIFSRHSNNNVPREELTHQIAGDIKNLNPLHRVEMKKPELVVIVEVIRNIVCLSVLPKYFHYRKYNLIEVSKPKVASSTQPVAEVVKSENELPGPLENCDDSFHKSDDVKNSSEGVMEQASTDSKDIKIEENVEPPSLPSDEQCST